MTLEQFAYIGDITASIAVVASLIYVARQVKQNTQANFANSRNTMLEADLDVLQDGWTHPALFDWRFKSELTIEEKVRLEQWLIKLMRTREHQWLQLRNGLLDEQTWKAYLPGVTVNLCFPRTRAWWNFVKDRYFDGEFVSQIDRILSETPLETDYRHTFDRFEN